MRFIYYMINTNELHAIIASRIAKSKGKCCLKSNHRLVNDGKDHYPINSLAQARNALSRVMQHEVVPPWFDGTLTQLRKIVIDCVKDNYESIDVEIKPRKSPKK